jgi:hypothetical protein
MQVSDWTEQVDGRMVSLYFLSCARIQAIKYNYNYITKVYI